MENPDVWSGKERNKYILKWLAGGSDERGRAVIKLDIENRLRMLMDALNSGNAKNAVVLKYPGRP